MEQRIIVFAERHGKARWGVSEAKAHISRNSGGTPETDSGRFYLVCLDMPNFADIHRIEVEVDEYEKLKIDSTYRDTAGCAWCEYGRVREHLQHIPFLRENGEDTTMKSSVEKVSKATSSIINTGTREIYTILVKEVERTDIVFLEERYLKFEYLRLVPGSKEPENGYFSNPQDVKHYWPKAAYVVETTFYAELQERQTQI